MDAASELLKLAQDKFGKLTPAEKKLFRAAAEGEIADYSPKSKKPIDPANAAKWGPSRVLLADRIAWLCTDKQAAQLVTHRGILMIGVRIDGMFDLGDAKVSFPLHFELCKFTDLVIFAYAQIVALYMPGTHTGQVKADALKVRGSVFLREGFKAEGEVYLPGATIGGDFDCSNAQFINKRDRALSADRLKVGGGVFLRDGFKAEGEVRLPGAMVGGDLSCTNGKFMNKDGRALCADGLKVGGAVFLRDGFQAKGEVRLVSAEVGGVLACENGQFLNRGGRSLSIDGLKVRGSVLFCGGFMAEGEVGLFGATIGGDLICENGQFINNSGRALSADGLKVGGAVFLRKGFKAQGKVCFIAATIDRFFFLADVDSPEKMELVLDSAKFGTLCDDQKSWPGPGHLSLHGLEYGEISNESPRDSKTRIEWLRRQKGFSPQPYEQLAKVLRESGDGAGARDVLVAKNKDKAKLSRTKLTFVENCWYCFFGPLIGYGHKPWLALRLALVIILLGLLFFKEGYSHGLVTPPSESAYVEDNTGTRRISEVYPVFNSLVYSIDVFVPVVDMHQVKFWLPNANRGSELVPSSSAALCTGGLLLFWLWFETACGWVLTTLLLVGLTGLVRT